MPPKTKINFKLEGLEKLVQSAGEAKKYSAKVGILGSKNQRSDENRSTSQIKENVGNADIGAVHEFGSYSKNIPRRSFLRDPFLLNRQQFGEQVKKIIDKNLVNGNVKRIFDLIGVAGVALVQKAFATSGFGKWKPLKSSTIAKKGSAAILIDSAQLRKSITFQTSNKK